MKRPKDFKVLLVYPNYSMVNLLPTNIGILTACLKQNGFIVDLFDTTFYRTAEKNPGRDPGRESAGPEV